jgi:formate-dependent nitrite reductase membrane component NrfD
MATLDPLAARRPDGGLFMWSEQPNVPHGVTSGHPGHANSSAAALLAYDVAHRAPWDWRVSLYTFTKSVAGGAYLVPALLVWLGLLPADSPVWTLGAPVAGGAFLAATGGLLLADLDHPERFYLIFTRGRWQSWLVRGAWLIVAFTALLVAHFALALLGATSALKWLALPGLPIAAMTAIYTAWLFAQAKARDLWQSPLLPPHFFVQAILAGSAALLPVAWALGQPTSALAGVLVASSVGHLLMVAGEASLPHPTAHARLAAHEMTSGRYRLPFRVGAALATLGVLAPWLGPIAALGALVGLALHEHAHVQAGQAVPLA